MLHRRLVRIGRHRKILLVVCGIIFAYTFSTSILQYNLSLFTNDLSTSYVFFGILMGLPWFFSLLVDMPVGAFADRYGKKHSMLVGFIGMGLSGFLLYIVESSLNPFLLLRLSLLS